MRRVLWCSGFVMVIAASLIADSNLRIADVGLHGYCATTCAWVFFALGALAVALTLRNLRRRGDL